MRLVGHYELLEEIGRGGMGIVYRARDTVMDRIVAVKAIRSDGPIESHDFLREGLLKEAKAAGNLSHPNIVTVHHVFQDQGTTFVAMEFVDGSSLETLLRDSSASLAQKMQLLRQAALALDYAHQNNIIHRDIKPGNVLIRKDGVVKLVDFGLAKKQSSATVSTMLAGSPNYMSPEQVQQQRLEGQSDQFSLAVIAFQLFTGKLPFVADSHLALMYQIAHNPPSGIDAVPRGVRWVIEKALSKTAPDRFPTCVQFVDALVQAHAATANSSTRSPSNIPVWWRYAVAASILLAVAVGVYVVSMRRPSPVSLVSAPQSTPSRVESQPAVGKQPETQTAPPRQKDTPRQQVKGDPAPKAERAKVVFSPPSSAPSQQSSPDLAEAPATDSTRSLQPPSIPLANPIVTGPPPTAAASPQPYTGPPSGMILFQGRLEANGAVTIENGKASVGALTGTPLPGVAVRVLDVSPDWIRVVAPPSASSGWRKITLRNSGPATSRFRVRWEIVRP